MTPRIGLLHGGASYHLRALDDPVVDGHVTDALYLGDLDAGRHDYLDDLDALVVADRLHPDLVTRHAAALHGVAERGALLVALGEAGALRWLPGLRASDRPTNFWWWRTGEDPGLHTHHPEHPLWAHLRPRDVVWHHHGVLHPPPGARTLVSADECPEGPGGAVLMIHEVGTAGRVVVTTMDPVHHHGSNFMPAASRLLHGLLAWIDDDVRARA